MGSAIDCVSLGPVVGTRIEGDLRVPLYRCSCDGLPNETTIAACARCKHATPRPDGRIGRSRVAEAAETPFVLPTGPGKHDHRCVDLRGLYRGAECWFLAGGPSAADMDLSPLASRGIALLTLNNSPAVLPGGVRPTIWMHTDPCGKFHDAVWRDPGVLKFSPVREWKERGKDKNTLRVKNEHGQLVGTGRQGWEMPGVVGFHRNTTFDPDTFLTEPSINRGNDKSSSERNGWPHVINSMFAVLRLAYELGFAKMFLLGVDFNMTASRQYACGETKTRGAARAMNSTFQRLETMLGPVEKRLAAAGLTVYNCTPLSQCGVFRTADYGREIRRVRESFPEILDATGFYRD